MPALRPSLQGALIGAAVPLLSLFLQGCGWERTMVFLSPSKRAAVEIWQTRVDNSWGTRAELVTIRGRSVLHENRVEAVVHFVHVYWSPDEAKVGVLVTGMNIWSVAADVDTGKHISFGSIRDDFAQSIRETYRVPLGKDPIRWAALVDGQDAFFKLHPEIRLTYRKHRAAQP